MSEHCVLNLIIGLCVYVMQVYICVFVECM